MVSTQAYLENLKKVIDGLPCKDIDACIQALLQACQAGHQVFVFGNGGSAATASHVANDLNKGCLLPGKPRFKAICLNDNVPLMTAWGNDSSYEDIFVEPLKNFLQKGDVVLAISASGNSPNVLKAVEYAKERGAKTVAWTGFGGGKLKPLADLSIVVPSHEYGPCEDLHLVLDHLMMQRIRELM
ncbi:MAG: SIS domain-containing protein [Candidatus Diapherotrites archaeon]|uniref:SIS domain-containing protein n=1 Tax=Candidatus Iainarchaeum sp. TaxID=3101447 RepID=A0A8T4LAA5_9ARCH|nr:SIS domain-containing protein [Candidatus Diapherotrites archaeon]